MTPEELAKIDEAIKREQFTPQSVGGFYPMNSSNIFKRSRAISSGQISLAQNFNTAYRGNGNPLLQRGVSTLQVGTNSPMAVPNAVLQKIQAEDAANKGRTNVIDTYFGKAGSGEYSSNAVLRNYLNKLSDNKLLQGTGAFNPNVAAQAQRDELASQRRQVVKGGLTENRSASGAITGGSMNAYDRINKEMAGIKNINPRAAINEENKRNALVTEALKRMKEFKATTSNLPILERVVSK